MSNMSNDNSKYALNIVYRHRKTGVTTNKTFVLSNGEQSTFENTLRSSFNIPKEEGVLLHCSDTIFYPISMIDLNLAGKIGTCELQSFSMAAMNKAQSNSMAAESNTSSTGTGARPSKKSKVANKPSGSQSNEKEDKRKFNRGLDQRRSYLKEEKIFVMLMKDVGRSAEEISQITGVSKSNVEKWCSDKVRSKVLSKFREEVKNLVVDDSLRESRFIHFSTKDPAKFKLLLEILADRLHKAQQQHFTSQPGSGSQNPAIPSNAFWKMTSNPTSVDPRTGKKHQVTVYSVESLLQYVLDQGYFFKKKSGDKDSISEITTSNQLEDKMNDDDISVETMSNVHISSSNHNPVTDFSVPQPAFISSEESDGMVFDDYLNNMQQDDNQSIGSSQWILPPSSNYSGNPATLMTSAPMAMPTVSEDFTTSVNMASDTLDDDEFDDDDNDDDSETSETCSLLMNRDNYNDITNLLIRQGVVPKITLPKVCQKPVDCKEELNKLLKDCCSSNHPCFVKSEVTMQFRNSFSVTCPVDMRDPGNTVTLKTVVPVQAFRGVLRNTKYLSTVSQIVSGKQRTEEEEEDAAVLSLLGE